VLRRWTSASSKNNVAMLKNQNGSLIQDDNENIFYFLHNVGLATLFLFYYSIRTPINQKNENILLSGCATIEATIKF
jgi:hypothetical protein